MNLIEKYKNQKDSILVMDNEEFNKYFDLIDVGNQLKMIVAPRRYGKSTFLIYKSIRESFFNNKNTLIIASTKRQERLLKDKLKKTGEEHNINKDILTRIDCASFNHNSIIGTSLLKYDYVLVDDSEYVGDDLLNAIIRLMHKDTKVAFTVSNTSLIREAGSTDDFISGFPGFQIIRIQNGTYEERIRQVENLNNFRHRIQGGI